VDTPCEPLNFITGRHGLDANPDATFALQNRRKWLQASPNDTANDVPNVGFGMIVGRSLFGTGRCGFHAWPSV
jgi:hypothetical protein